VSLLKPFFDSINPKRLSASGPIAMQKWMAVRETSLGNDPTGHQRISPEISDISRASARTVARCTHTDL
jgi:hypothetical protein